MTQTNYYLDDYTDEMIPCAATLEGWAEWLAKPDPDDFTLKAPAADGTHFSGFTIEVLGDIRVEHLDGEWQAVEPERRSTIGAAMKAPKAGMWSSPARVWLRPPI